MTRTAQHASLHAAGPHTLESRTGLDLADLAAQHALRWRAFSQQAPNLAVGRIPQHEAAERGIVVQPGSQDFGQGIPDMLHATSH